MPKPHNINAQYNVAKPESLPDQDRDPPTPQNVRDLS